MSRSIADIIAEALPDYAPADPIAFFTEEQREEHSRLAKRMNQGAATAVMRDRIRRREASARIAEIDADAIVAELRSNR